MRYAGRVVGHLYRIDGITKDGEISDNRARSCGGSQRQLSRQRKILVPKGCLKRLQCGGDLPVSGHAQYPIGPASDNC